MGFCEYDEYFVSLNERPDRARIFIIYIPYDIDDQLENYLIVPLNLYG